MRERTLVVSGAQHERLKQHLFPGDGKEAAAILLCTRVSAGGLKLLVRDAVLIPHAECERESDRLSWPGDYLDAALAQADADDLSLVLLHSHPTGYYGFSRLDDESDRDVMPCLFLARRRERANTPMWHGSAIMVSGGAVRARFYDETHRTHMVDLVAVYGDDIQFYWGNDTDPKSRPLAFSDEMTREFGGISAAVVGFSGTGSVVGEQLLRIGVGEIIAIDHDCIENKNLNRILNSTQDTAKKKALKVEAFKDAAARIRPSTRVIAVPAEIGLAASIETAAAADIVFCCVDSEEGRHVCDRLAAAMLQPLIDVGVSIPVRTPARGMTISNICGRIDYVQPGGATLFDRGVYTPQSLAAESLRKSDPKAFADRVKEGYMPGAGQEAPSVICVNMRAASAAILELVARAYPYRLDGNAAFSRTEFDLVLGEESHVGDEAFERRSSEWFAKGLSFPLLGLPYLEDGR